VVAIEIAQIIRIADARRVGVARRRRQLELGACGRLAGPILKHTSCNAADVLAVDAANGGTTLATYLVQKTRVDLSVAGDPNHLDMKKLGAAVMV
jgi:hypothetical protein